MKISIDIDGVLADFVGGAVRLANCIWPNKLAENYQPPDWNFSDAFTSDEFKHLWRELKNTPDFWEDLPVYKDNKDSLRWWLQTKLNNSELFFITARIPTQGNPVEVQTKTWLKRNGIWDNRATLIVVPNSDAKKPLIKKLGINRSIDDYGPTVVHCNEMSKNHLSYLLCRPWNTMYANVPWVDSLDEFLQKVKG